MSERRTIRRVKWNHPGAWNPSFDETVARFGGDRVKAREWIEKAGGRLQVRVVGESWWEDEPDGDEVPA